jgi:hypothetical protein
MGLENSLRVIKKLFRFELVALTVRFSFNVKAKPAFIIEIVFDRLTQ